MTRAYAMATESGKPFSENNTSDSDRYTNFSSNSDAAVVSQTVGWFAALCNRFRSLNGQSLRDTLEAALKTDDTAPDSFSQQERAILMRLLRYGALRIDDVMVPRADIVAIEENETVGQALQLFVKAGVSRLPLYRDTLDDPIGMVHVKDLVRWLVEFSDKAELHGDKEKENSIRNVVDINLRISDTALARPLAVSKVKRRVLYVPPSMPAMNLLLRMQSTRIHMALVVDEYGGTDGLVSIEDLVEEIVGEIEDEHDEFENPKITGDTTNGMVALARTPVADLERHLNLRLLSEDSDVDTLGGLVFSLVGRVPARGELVRHPEGVEFEVLDADPRRIKKLKIHLSKVVLGGA
ncbi:MAG TPA: hypothetical protein TECP_01209 [Hyphomicrobiaceae bacterium MAG_BT-2024]